MSKTLRVFLTCAIGAFIGSVIALQMGHRLWWVGSLVGAATAYLGYNFEEVLAAVPVAFAKASAWRPNHTWWRAYRNHVKAVCLFVLNAVTMMSILAYLFVTTLMKMTGDRHVNEQLLVFGGCSIVFFATGVMVGLLSICAGMSESEVILQSFADGLQPIAVNPLKFWFVVVPVGMVNGLAWLVFQIPFALVMARILIFEGSRIAKRFAVEYFRLIHSEVRLLCAVDAALGTAIGYFTGNAIVGTIAGGLLGVLNYEIVTVRWLKLAGAKSIISR